MTKHEFGLEEIFKSIDKLIESAGGEKPEERPVTGHSYQRNELKERGFGAAQIEEIELGIAQQIAVHHYARSCYNWKQMREIRIGLFEGLDVKIYENPLFSAAQMKEIRLGMLEHIDVTAYADLLWSERDMMLARKRLLSEAYRSNPGIHTKQVTDEKSGVHIRISDDCMQAYVRVPKETELTMPELARILKENDVVRGISQIGLKKALDSRGSSTEVLVAEGVPAKQGSDGVYKFFFNPELPGDPVIREDGSVDYSHVVVAERREAGDVLARYTPPEQGTNGETVTGISISGSPGKELPALEGHGILRDVTGNIYMAEISGYVTADEAAGILNVWDAYVIEGDLNRYNGNISYNGSVYIRGAVCDMVHIEASGDVIVDGYVEGANIRAGGGIVLRSGMNGCGRGSLEAGGKITGKFFEAASLSAKDNIEGNYFLNCTLVTDKDVVTKGAKSRITGGSIRAAGSVETYYALLSDKIGTVIEVGNLQWIHGRRRAVSEKLYKSADELKQLREGRDKISEMLGKEVAETNTLYHKVGVAIAMKEEETANLTTELTYYDMLLERAENAGITVWRKLQAGIVISVGGKKKRIEQDMGSAVTFRKEDMEELSCGRKF